MPHDARAYLWDVLDSAEDIQRFLSGVDEAGYAENALVHSAVERKFEVIGEALSQLSKRSPDIAARIPPLREIVAFRNVLIHGYASIDHGQVYRIAHSALPTLVLIVRRLMDQIAPDAAS